MIRQFRVVGSHDDKIGARFFSRFEDHFLRRLMVTEHGLNGHVMALGGGDAALDVKHIPPEITTPDEDGPGVPDDGGAMGSLAGTSLEALEKRAIRETLRLTGGNREQASKLLGIGERTLYRKLKEYGLR